MTPDLVDEPGVRAWMDSGASLVSSDAELRLHDDTVPVQTLHTSWNAGTLRLAWSGANWDLDGDLFVYFDTAPGGATALHDPYATGGSLTFPTSFAPDWLVMVEDAAMATLLHWNGSAWVLDRVLIAPNFGHDAPHTDLLLPFGWLG